MDVLTNRNILSACVVTWRSQWPRGLRHEPSLSARTLGSWVRIPLYVRFFCVYVVLCVGSGLAMG
jgi:hypothetical protein